MSHVKNVIVQLQEGDTEISTSNFDAALEDGLQGQDANSDFSSVNQG